LASKYAQESAEQLEDDEEYSLADEIIHETTVSGNRPDDEHDSRQALRTAYRSLLDVLTSATIAPGDDRTCVWRMILLMCRLWGKGPLNCNDISILINTLALAATKESINI
jgi:hypothetical protein